MVNSQDADAGSVVEDHDQNFLSLPVVEGKIGTKSPRKNEEHYAIRGLINSEKSAIKILNQ